MDPEHIITKAIEDLQGPLTRYAMTITGNLESARDAVQESFLRLSRQDVAELEPRLTSWLFCVCRNCAIDYRRKIIRMPVVAAEEMPEVADGGPDPSEVTGANEDYARVRLLVGQLPEIQRELITLKFNADLSYQEMATVTGLSVSNVGVQIHGAIEKMRRWWASAEKKTGGMAAYG